jgi:hypothetical protein
MKIIVPYKVRMPFTFKRYCKLNGITIAKAKHYKAYINERNVTTNKYFYKYQWFNAKGKCIAETYEPQYTLTDNDKGIITCKQILKWKTY